MAEYSEIIGIFLQIGIIFLSITMILCLVRAVKGPKLADRIIATNMVGIKTIMLIAMVAVYIEGDFLIDVAMVYALLSFLAVVVFARYMLRVKANRAKKDNK
jgi:multicomponent Na+:H+ antiporter subunit F